MKITSGPSFESGLPLRSFYYAVIVIFWKENGLLVRYLHLNATTQPSRHVFAQMAKGGRRNTLSRLRMRWTHGKFLLLNI